MTRMLLAFPLVYLVFGCGAEKDAFEPFPAPLFDAYDLNPDSPHHKATLSMADRKGEVTALYFSSYTCPYCITHYPALYSAFQDLAGEDLYPAKVELWIMGYPVSGSKVADFCKGTDASCFVDSRLGPGSVYSEYSASLGQIYLIDQKLVACRRFDLVSCPMERAECKARLQGSIRSLVETGADQALPLP